MAGPGGSRKQTLYSGTGFLLTGGWRRTCSQSSRAGWKQLRWKTASMPSLQTLRRQWEAAVDLDLGREKQSSQLRSNTKIPVAAPWSQWCPGSRWSLTHRNCHCRIHPNTFMGNFLAQYWAYVSFTNQLSHPGVPSFIGEAMVDQKGSLTRPKQKHTLLSHSCARVEQNIKSKVWVCAFPARSWEGRYSPTKMSERARQSKRGTDAVYYLPSGKSSVSFPPSFCPSLSVFFCIIFIRL